MKVPKNHHSRWTDTEVEFGYGQFKTSNTRHAIYLYVHAFVQPNRTIIRITDNKIKIIIKV